MADPEIVREWITKADEDIEFARLNLLEERIFFAQICFHFQQSAEKYLKAYIIANDLQFRRIHDLATLLRICLAEDTSFQQLEDHCEYLNAFYIEARYPVHWSTNFSKEEAEKAFHSPENIRNFVRDKLSLD